MTKAFDDSDVVVYAPMGMPRLDVVLSQESTWAKIAQVHC